MHTWAWFAIAGIFAVLEVLTLALVFASFAIGAVAAGLISFAGGNTALSQKACTINRAMQRLIQPWNDQCWRFMRPQ